MEKIGKLIGGVLVLLGGLFISGIGLLATGFVWNGVIEIWSALL